MRWRPVLYRELNASHQWRWAGQTIFIWFFFILFTVSLGLGLWAPTFWLIAISLLVAVGLALFLVDRTIQRHRYILWQDEKIKAVAPQALSPVREITLRASGVFSVNGKKRYCRARPGFYETFVTREHVIAVHVREKRFGGWQRGRTEDIGMWYAFLVPRYLQSVTPGTVFCVQRAYPGLKLTYQDKTERLLFYLFFDQRAARDTVWADLLEDIKEHV